MVLVVILPRVRDEMGSDVVLTALQQNRVALKKRFVSSPMFPYSSFLFHFTAFSTFSLHIYSQVMHFNSSSRGTELFQRKRKPVNSLPRKKLTFRKAEEKGRKLPAGKFPKDR